MRIFQKFTCSLKSIFQVYQLIRKNLKIKIKGIIVSNDKIEKDLTDISKME